MKHLCYILDFDGVICHSAVEIAYVAWQCARRIWPAKFEAEEITDAATRRFLEVRPYLEYGAESIVMMKLLAEGWTREKFATEFCGHSEEMITACGQSRQSLIAAFGAARDELIASDREFWLGLNHCYHQSAVALQALLREKAKVLILTTKQERFVKLILAKAGMALPDDCIIGMDAGRRKMDVVAEVATAYPGGTAYVEDRLESLKAVLQDDRNAGKVQLYLADWGYASKEQLEEARNFAGICRISSLEETL